MTNLHNMVHDADYTYSRDARAAHQGEKLGLEASLRTCERKTCVPDMMNVPQWVELLRYYDVCARFPDIHCGGTTRQFGLDTPTERRPPCFWGPYPVTDQPSQVRNGSHDAERAMHRGIAES